MITKLAYSLYKFLNLCVGHCGGGHCNDIGIKTKNK